MTYTVSGAAFKLYSDSNSITSCMVAPAKDQKGIDRSRMSEGMPRTAGFGGYFEIPVPL